MGVFFFFSRLPWIKKFKKSSLLYHKNAKISLLEMNTRKTAKKFMTRLADHSIAQLLLRSEKVLLLLLCQRFLKKFVLNSVEVNLLMNKKMPFGPKCLVVLMLSNSLLLLNWPAEFTLMLWHKVLS